MLPAEFGRVQGVQAAMRPHGGVVLAPGHDQDAGRRSLIASRW
jgi:hypothetical protein